MVEEEERRISKMKLCVCVCVYLCVWSEWGEDDYSYTGTWKLSEMYSSYELVVR